MWRREVMRVLVETMDDVIEGDVIDGERLDEVSDTFDLESIFTVRCDDGECVKIHGWLVEVEILPDESPMKWIM